MQNQEDLIVYEKSNQLYINTKLTRLELSDQYFKVVIIKKFNEQL